MAIESNLTRCSMNPELFAITPKDRCSTRKSVKTMESSSSEKPSFTTYWVKVQETVSSFVFSSVRDRHEAEDLLQEIATAVYSQMDKYDPSKPFLPWVLGIARNKVLMYYRSKKSDKHMLSEGALLRIELAHAKISPEVSTRREALDICLGKLQSRARDCLKLRYSEEVAVKDIARELNTTPNAISMVLNRARAALKDCIERAIRSEIP